MNSTSHLSTQAVGWIQRYIFDLRTGEDLNEKSISQDTSDLRHFAEWVEASWNTGQEHEIFFDPVKMTTPTLIRYREFMQTIRFLKPTTVNRRLDTLKRFFHWAAEKGVISVNISKPVKLVPEEKTIPRQRRPVNA